MKKNLLILFALAVAFASGYTLAPTGTPATVTLTNPMSLGNGASAPTTDPLVALTKACFDQGHSSMTFYVTPLVSQTLNAGKTVSVVVDDAIPPIVTTVNTQSGQWSSSNGLCGTLTGASLTGAQGWLTNGITSVMKTQAETAWIGMGITPGVATAWQ